MEKSLSYEPGEVVDGKVVYDETRNEYLLKTDSGYFSVQDYLKTQYGSEVRVTCARIESLQAMVSFLYGSVYRFLRSNLKQTCFKS